MTSLKTNKMKFLKLTIYIISAFFLIPSCTKDCCYDGNLTTPDEVLDAVGSNELTDTIFSAAISGTINSVNGKPIKNITIILTDTLGRDFKFITDNEGKFERTKLLSGKYNLRFENLSLYKYSFDEYNTIIDDMTDIIIGAKIATKAEKIAYHIVNFDDGITTWDSFHFTRFRDGQDDLINHQPWRLISRSDYDNNNLKIQDNIEINVKENENFLSDILLIYVGDPTGYTL
jgi:hypothetical protein